MIQDKHTLSWSFYTPLAAAELWIIARHYPEFDGSDQVTPGGGNPEVCVIDWEKGSYIGIYTAESRAWEAFERVKISRSEWIPVSAQGYSLLRYLSKLDASLWMNCGLVECQYHLDPDMVEILLSRPEPPPAVEEPKRMVDLDPAGDPQRFLGPLREFLSQKPTVRAAWVFGHEPDSPLPDGHESYEVGLVMEDPEDESLLEQVCVIAKAVTPVEMEWTTAVMMAEDKALRKLARERPPFYEAPDFLKRSSGR